MSMPSYKSRLLQTHNYLVPPRMIFVTFPQGEIRKDQKGSRKGSRLQDSCMPVERHRCGSAVEAYGSHPGQLLWCPLPTQLFGCVAWQELGKVQEALLPLENLA